MVTIARHSHPITLLWLLLALSTSASADFQAYVDRSTVTLGETFELLIKSDTKTNSSPDLEPLQADFEVLSQSQSSSISVVNGEFSQVSQWSLTLMAKRSGRLTIPPISIGPYSTQPVPLRVVETVNTADEPNDVYIETETTPDSPYVQAQVIHTLRLYWRVQMSNGSLNELNINKGDAIVERLGEDKNYEQTVNGHRYHVLERRWAIFPQVSGPLQIAPLLLQAQIPGNSSRSRLPGFFSRDLRTIRRHSKATTLDVQPIPDTYKEANWLPARQLIINEIWSNGKDAFIQGQPVTRTISILAEGLTSGQLPELDVAEVDELRVYPEIPSLKNMLSKDGIRGLRQQKTAIIPNNSGEYLLPAIHISWWDTETKQKQVATLPARTIRVKPSAASPVLGPAAETLTPLSGISETTQEFPAAAIEAPLVTGPWRWVSLLLALGWAGSLAFGGYYLRRKPTISEITEPPVNVNAQQARGALKSACQAHQLSAARAALIDWVKARWPEKPPTLATLIQQVGSASLAEAIQAMDASGYADGAGDWDGTTLWDGFSAATAKASEPSDQNDAFSDLFRLQSGG